MNKVLIFGGAGRVGTQIAIELLRAGQTVVLADLMPQDLLQRRAGRLQLDARLATVGGEGTCRVYGGVDALDRTQVREIIERERPDLVINYAIPITWDATKRLPNYQRLSAAGLGAFTPIQVYTPRIIGEAMHQAGLDAPYLVGNLPDITIPVLTGSGHSTPLARPVCGAGNVGLIATAIERQVKAEYAVPGATLTVDLVAHHIHWVAPREPGYADDAPFLLRVCSDGTDITSQFGDARQLLNRAINENYEPDAGFSSTTGILASRVARALLDESGNEHRLHLPAVEGLPGGYPAIIQNGNARLDLPATWSRDQALSAMQQAQQRDGVEAIEDDGTVRFTDYARDILREELDFELPATMPPGDIEAVAREQIQVVTRHIES